MLLLITCVSFRSYVISNVFCSIFSGDEVELDKYCVAAASAELGLLLLDMGKLEEAQKTLDATK